MSPARRWGLAGLVVGLVVAVDQVTKAWAADSLPGAPRVVIEGWLEFVYAENTGFAFGLFNGTGIGWLLALVAVAAIVVVTVMIARASLVAEVVGLALIAAGAAGNLIDRLVRGEGIADGFVVDFIKVPFIPNFNVADASLTVGVVVLLLVSMRAEAHAR